MVDKAGDQTLPVSVVVMQLLRNRETLNRVIELDRQLWQIYIANKGKARLAEPSVAGSILLLPVYFLSVPKWLLRWFQRVHTSLTALVQLDFKKRLTSSQN